MRRTRRTPEDQAQVDAWKRAAQAKGLAVRKGSTGWFEIVRGEEVLARTIRTEGLAWSIAAYAKA